MLLSFMPMYPPPASQMRGADRRPDRVTSCVMLTGSCHTTTSWKARGFHGAAYVATVQFTGPTPSQTKRGKEGGEEKRGDHRPVGLNVARSWGGEGSGYPEHTIDAIGIQIYLHITVWFS